MNTTYKNNLIKWVNKSGHTPIKITIEDFIKSISKLDSNPDWRVVEFNCNDLNLNCGRVQELQVIHMQTSNCEEKTIFVFLRMSGPQIDEWDTSTGTKITSRSPMVIQFDIDESATQYTGKIEDYFDGIPRAESGPRYK